MTSSAEGIVGKAATFTGVIRPDLISIVLMNDNFEPLPNIKCEVKFSDGQTVEATSDAEGVLTVPRKAQGKFEIKLLEEMKTEETSASSK